MNMIGNKNCHLPIGEDTWPVAFDPEILNCLRSRHVHNCLVEPATTDGIEWHLISGQTTLRRALRLLPSSFNKRSQRQV